MADDLVNGWRYHRDSSGAVSAVDPNGQQRSFPNWDAFWREANGKAAQRGGGRSLGWTIVGVALAWIAAVYIGQHPSPSSPSPPRELAAGRGEDMVSTLGCNGKWSDDKKKAVFDSDYKDKLTTITEKIAKAGDGTVDLKVLPSTLTYDIQVRMANAGDTYSLNKDEVVTFKFVPTMLGGCILSFDGKEGVIVSR
jgi:hypothetical protein